MSLLVPIDLSAPSRCAIRLAARIGRATGETALILHVSEGPTPLDHLARLHALATPLRDAGLQARLREVVGQPAEQICLEAERRAVRWVIMGTRGDWSAVASPGSVARTVLERAPISLSGVPGSNTRELAESLASALGGRIVSVGRRPPATAPLDLVIVERADLSPWEELVEPLARLSCPVAVVSTPA